MSLRKLRLTISGCVLPTALAWAVAGTLRDWCGHSALEEEEEAKLSPYWIPMGVVRYLSYGDFYRRNTHKVGIQDETKYPINHLYNSNRVMNVFGSAYVNAVDIPVCSLVDSATCVRHTLPVDEAGEIIWPLIKPLRSTGMILSNGKPIPKFGSPYWVEGDGLYTRWGVKPQSNINPFYLSNGMWFLNAEQTTDASRFDSLSCGPQRRHQCITVDGVITMNWDLSKKLHESHTEIKTKSSHKNTVMSFQEISSNLWIDVKLIEALQWTLDDGAVGVEVPSYATSKRPWILNPSKTDTDAKSLVVTNADFVTERDALVSLIRYKPDFIGLKTNMYADSFTTVRLSLIASMRKYVSTVWVTSDVVEKEHLRGRNKSEFTGAEVKLLQSGGTPSTIILINIDELDISQVHVDELKVRYKQSSSHT